MQIAPIIAVHRRITAPESAARNRCTTSAKIAIQAAHIIDMLAKVWTGSRPHAFDPNRKARPRPKHPAVIAIKPRNCRRVGTGLINAKNTNGPTTNTRKKIATKGIMIPSIQHSKCRVDQIVYAIQRSMSRHLRLRVESVAALIRAPMWRAPRTAQGARAGLIRVR